VDLGLREVGDRFVLGMAPVWQALPRSRVPGCVPGLGRRGPAVADQHKLS